MATNEWTPSIQLTTALRSLPATKDDFGDDIARISELNSVLLGLLSSLGQGLRAVTADTARLEREVGGLREERARETARRERPAIKVLETVREALPEAFAQSFTQLTDLVVDLDRKVELSAEQSAAAQTSIGALNEFRGKAEGSIEGVRQEVRALASRLGAVVEATQSRLMSEEVSRRDRAKRSRQRRSLVENVSLSPDRSGSVSPRPEQSVPASTTNSAEGETRSERQNAPPSASAVEREAGPPSGQKPSEDATVGQSLDQGYISAVAAEALPAASVSDSPSPLTALEGVGGSAPSAIAEDASVLRSFKQAMQSLGISGRAELHNAELRLEELPGHPLLRHLSRSLEIARSADSEDDGEELYRVTAALVTRVTQLEARMSEVVEPRLAAGTAAISRAEARSAELADALGDLSARMDSLRGAVESLEHRLMVMAEERQSSPVASPVTSPARQARREKEVLDPATALANNLGRARELWLRVFTELGHVLHAFHKVLRLNTTLTSLP